MALYISIQTCSYPNNEVDVRTFVCHTGEELHYDIMDNLQNVTEVQADGEELDRIRNNMPGIPQALTKKAVRFYGDHAKFITANW